MKLAKLLATSAAAIALSTAVAPHVMAQQITSEIRGVVTDSNGAPVRGATVRVVDTRTGSTRTLSTGANGEFSARNLTVGGPYSVSVDTDEYRDETIENINVSLGGASALTFALEAAAAGGGDEIIVTASRSNTVQLAIGPNSAFDLNTLESFPSISRDIRDIIRIDPRVSIDLAGEVQRVTCLGGNDRSNTFTVDGVIQADVFGLNGTPFASRNAQVIPFDAISQTTVEFAPFDVEYGQFTGCNINVVTKSGSNEFHGAAFFNYAGSGLQGKSIEGSEFTVAPFDDFNWGASLGGPVIKDKLFFFAAYEETDDADSQDEGPAGGNFANENITGVPDLATVLQVQDILENVYGIETGGVARSLPQSSRRFLTRWDWLITDDHRLEFTYQRLRETNVESDDFGFEPVGFTFLNSFEDEGTNSEVYSARLFSQWNENFSTEIRASRADVSDIQGPVGGGEAQSANPIPRIIVGVGNGDNVTAGPGQFRSANQLDTQVDQIKALATYTAGAHTLTAGYELNQLDVFNLFIVNATGTLVFNSIADFQAGLISGGTDDFPTFDEINNGVSVGAQGNFSFTGNPVDAAASFSRSIHAFYGQDEWQVNDRLNVLLGLRYEFYAGDDTPLENQNFIDRYGFTNARDFSNLNIFLPRVGITYDVPLNIFGETQIRLGAGRFTGGDPTVWFSNAFSNSGNLNGFGSFANNPLCTPADRQVLNGGVFTGVPQCVIQDGSNEAALGLADTQSTDLDLELASIWRANFGFTTTTDFGGAVNGLLDNWQVNADYIRSHFENPYSFVDLSQTVNPALGLGGLTADGLPIYRAIDPTVAGCTAQLVSGGTPPVYQNVNAPCFSTGRDDEIQLTNTDGFVSETVSVAFSKEFELTSPLTSAPGSVNVNFGYAWTDSDNRRDLTSAQSTSNFDGTALSDRQNPSVATSGFETRHNVTFAANFRQEFIRDYATRIGFFFSAASGRPYSYTFDGSGDFVDSSSGTDNQLLYVPNGINDPLISPLSNPAAVAALVNFIDNDLRAECIRGDRGGIATRNACRNDWFLDLDMRFQQELPLPGNFANDRLVLFADVDNLANLVSDRANLRRITNTTVDLVDVAIDSQGRYIITDFAPDFNERIDVPASIWSVQFGIRYEF